MNFRVILAAFQEFLKIYDKHAPFQKDPKTGEYIIPKEFEEKNNAIAQLLKELTPELLRVLNRFNHAYSQKDEVLFRQTIMINTPRENFCETMIKHVLEVRKQYPKTARPEFYFLHWNGLLQPLAKAA